MSCKIRIGGQKRPERAGAVAIAVGPTLPLQSSEDTTAQEGDYVNSVSKRLCLGTWSHTDLPDRFSPCDMSKKDFGELLQSLWEDIFSMPNVPGRKRRKANRLLKVAVFQEKHGAVFEEQDADGTIHYHFPMLAEWPWSWKYVAKRLREHGIYVHFSTSHTYYWTALMYLAVPSDVPDGKREADLDPEPWLCADHPSLRDALEDIPRGARTCDKSRVRRFLGLVCPGSEHRDVALSDKQFNTNIVKKGLRNHTAVLAWVQLKSEEVQHMTAEERMELVGMEAYCLRNQADLARRIAFAWDLHSAPRTLALQEQTAWQAVLAARNSTCTCSGQWIPLTEQLLAMHVLWAPPTLCTEAPHSIAVRAALRRCLQEGCKKFTNVFIYGPKTSGKSHVAKAVAKIFQDRAFQRPVGQSNFPLQAIFGKKVCVLQDIRVDTFKLGFDALLVWWEGESFPVPLPQNRHDGDRTYTEAAPVIVTSGDKLRISAGEAKRLQVDPQKQNAMMDDRFVYFHFPRTFHKDEVVEVDPCARCCAEWITGESPFQATAQTAVSTSSSSRHAPSPAPPPNLLQSTPVACGIQPQNPAVAFVALLERLQRLHTTGALSDGEYAAAKRKLLQLG